MKPHKWAKEIKAWADGAEIEARTLSFGGTYTDWYRASSPLWDTGDVEYRIKPQPKEPQYLYVYFDHKLGYSREAYFVSMFKPTESLMQTYRCITKIKLELEDGTDLG